MPTSRDVFQIQNVQDQGHNLRGLRHDFLSSRSRTVLVDSCLLTVHSGVSVNAPKIYEECVSSVTGQLADKPTRGQSSRGLVIGQLAD